MYVITLHTTLASLQALVSSP